ncbi:MAG: PD40 domain-containing protein, partial [Anaerolineae bacterium]|nr:PD40 domain-containing protein [Anaerolineae bacterium]
MPFRIRTLSLAVIALLLGVGGLILPAGAQGDGQPTEDLLRKLVAFLSDEIDQPVRVVDSFTYSAETFPDSALGCPVDGETYTPGEQPGYTFLITIQGVSYDVRATLDGSAFVLCRNTAIEQNVGLSTFRTREYSIPYPSPWTVTEREGDVYFGLAATPICNQPGMIVAELGPSQGKTPDQLLEEYTPNARNAQFDPDRTSIRRIGRSATYTAPCADATLRKHRITFLVAYGQAYRVLQFAPADAYGQWAGVFQSILDEFGPSTLGSSEGGQAMVLPPVAPLAGIAHLFGGNVYIGALTDLPGAPVTTGATADRPYRSPVFSPRGDAVAFIDPNEGGLYVTQNVAQYRPGAPPRRLALGVDPAYPPAWSADGSQIAYVAGGEGGMAEAHIVDLAGADRRLGEAYPYGPCPDAPVGDPADGLYAAEAGLSGNYPGALDWAPDGRLYFSGPCGMGILTIPVEGGAAEPFSTSLYRARLSPDGSSLAGIIDVAGADGGITPAITLVRLADRSAVTLPTGATPDVVGWNADGKALYYSTMVQGETVTLDESADAERGLAIFGVWPVRAAVFDVALRRIDLTTGIDAEVFRVTGRGIGRITASPDGSGVLFTLVQSANVMLEAFANGVSTGELLRQAP